MSSEKGAAHRASSRSRPGVSTLDGDVHVHRSKRESSRDLDAAHVIDVSVPRTKAGRSDSKTRSKDAVERTKTKRSDVSTVRPKNPDERVKAGRSDSTVRHKNPDERVKAGRSDSTVRHKEPVERVRTAHVVDEEDVKRHVRKMRESASKVREAVKDGRPRLSRSGDTSLESVVGETESKKPSPQVKTPTKPSVRVSTNKAVETPSPRARETTRKPVESSRSKTKSDPVAKPSEKVSKGRRSTDEKGAIKEGQKDRDRMIKEGQKERDRTMKEGQKERDRTTREGMRDKVRATKGVEERDRMAKQRRLPEDSVREKTMKTHRKDDGVDKTKSKSRRADIEAVEKVSERRKSKEEKDHKLREAGDRSLPKERTQDDRKEKPSKPGGDGDGKPRERNRTRVLSPSEVRVARDVAAQVAAVGGTNMAGARRGSDARRTEDDRRSAVASTSKTPDVVTTAIGDDAEEDADEEYEDDFEDYESDFEEDSSDDREDSVVPELTSRQAPTTVDEEKKLDSGNYDLAENQKRSKYLNDIKAAMDRENSALDERRRDVPVKEMSTMVDEGFEEEKSEELPRGSNFINFASARKRQKEQKLTAHSRRRGDALLSMITLDVVKFRLFEMPPVPYDAFMSRYGRAGTAQAHAQTNDDRLDEDVQTDEIRTRDCWTQRPASCGGATDGVVKTTREQELLGVGAVLPEDETTSDNLKTTRPSRTVEQFLNATTPLMLSALREGRSYRALQPNTADVGFSKGFISLQVNALPFLANRAVTLVRYPPQQPGKLLTVHASVEGAQDADADASLRRCVVCVWSVRTPDVPLHTLASWRDVTAACFESERATLVLAGLDDGAVVVWDLRDAATHHGDVDVDADAGKWRLRSPTYSTAEVLRDDGHLGRVVSLQPLIDKDADKVDDFAPTQVCSLEESGVAIVWTVIQGALPGVKSGASQQDLGLAYWGRVRLVKTSMLTLDDVLPTDQLSASPVFSDMQINALDCHHVFASADTGQVVHALTSGAKPTPRVYHPKQDGLTFAQCIETFPFGHSLFLVGCGDGSIRLHRRESDNPLTVLAGTGEAPGQGPVIRALQWSRSRPTVFFVLDDLSRVHVWDLGLSDMYPRLTATPSSGGVSSIQMAPDPRDGKACPQMVIATSNGDVQVHELKDEYRFRTVGDMTKELNNFIRFTNIL